MTSGISWVGGLSGEQISSRPQSNHMFYIFVCARFFCMATLSSLVSDFV